MSNSLLRHFAAALVVIMLTLAGCSGRGDITRTIDDAQGALEAGNYAVAREMATSLLQGDTTRLTALDYGRLSLIFIRIADLSDQEVNTDVEHAVGCCRRALETGHDEAMQFYRTGPVENDRYVMMLTSLVTSLDTPDADTLPEGFDPSAFSVDSIPLDTLSTWQ